MAYCRSCGHRVGLKDHAWVCSNQSKVSPHEDAHIFCDDCISIEERGRCDVCGGRLHFYELLNHWYARHEYILEGKLAHSDDCKNCGMTMIVHFPCQCGTRYCNNCYNITHYDGREWASCPVCQVIFGMHEYYTRQQRDNPSLYKMPKGWLRNEVAFKHYVPQREEQKRTNTQIL
jgi:uncharacterized C2H2 Zn-finger protein